MFYSHKLLETDWIFRILKILCHKNAYSRNLYLEGHIRILMLKGHKSFLEFFWNLFCQLEGCVLMAIYVTHHNFAEVYIFEFLPLCVMGTEWDRILNSQVAFGTPYALNQSGHSSLQGHGHNTLTLFRLGSGSDEKKKNLHDGNNQDC